MSQRLTYDEFIAWLETECRLAGSQLKLAERLGIHPNQIQEVRTRKVYPPPKLLRRLGWKRCAGPITFARMEEGEPPDTPCYSPTAVAVRDAHRQVLESRQEESHL